MQKEILPISEVEWLDSLFHPMKLLFLFNNSENLSVLIST